MHDAAPARPTSCYDAPGTHRFRSNAYTLMYPTNTALLAAPPVLQSSTLCYRQLSDDRPRFDCKESKKPCLD